MGGADHQQDVVRFEISRGRGLVGDLDRMAGAGEDRLQRVGHHLGVARFGADQDQDTGHRPPTYGTPCRPATRPVGAGAKRMPVWDLWKKRPYWLPSKAVSSP